MEEPTVALLLAGDFDDRAAVEIRRREFPELLDFVDHGGEDATFPAAGLAVAGHAIDRVPTPAVDFPRHLRLFADGVEIDVVFARLLGGRRVERLPLRVGAGGEDRLEHFAGIGAE